jgi:hypothetical protein
MLKDHFAPKANEDCNVFKQVKLQGMELDLIASISTLLAL